MGHAVRDAPKHIVTLDTRVLSENLVDAVAGGEEVEHERNPYAVPADARPPPANGGVHADALEEVCVHHELEFTKPVFVEQFESGQKACRQMPVLVTVSDWRARLEGLRTGCRGYFSASGTFEPSSRRHVVLNSAS